MGAANQAVEGTFGDDGVGEERIPVFGYPVGGDYEGAVAVPTVNEFINILSLGLGKFFHGEVIHYE